MALTQSQIEERIATLEGGMALVEAGTTFADRGVTYRSAEQLTAQISYYQGRLNSLLGRARQTLIVSSKGF